MCLQHRQILENKPLNPQGTRPTRLGSPIQRSLAISCTIESLILCCYIIKVVPLLCFHPSNGLNPFLFSQSMVNSSGTSHSPQGLEWLTPKAACDAFSLFRPATLQRTLNRTFHSPRHRGNPLNDDRERKIPSHCLVIPFHCQAGVSPVRESNMASSRWMSLRSQATECEVTHEAARAPRTN